MMKRLLVLASLSLIVSMGAPSSGHAADLAAEPITCECENSSCGPCEVETGTNFYSAKCGPGNARVKSCKKPTCEAVENQKACLAELEQKSSSGEEMAVAKKAVEPAKTSVASSAAGSRMPASVGAPAGDVDDVTGVARVIRVKGQVETATKKLAVYVGDVLETGDTGRLKVILKDSSEMVLPPNSKVQVEKVDVDNEKDRRQIMLNLLMGKVRSRVEKDYRNQENSYQVRTRTAVAGVRGTVFVASFEPGDKKWITQIHTFEGRVQLGGKNAETHPGAENTVMVEAGSKAAFEIDAPSDPSDEAKLDKAISDGTLLPIFNMTDDEKKLVDEATSFLGPNVRNEDQTSRAVASAASDDVCAAPQGKYNQCSWTCEGNPAGDKKCRTDLPGVACVRRLCRANGQWTEPKRMPSSQSDTCVPQKPVVGECGSYW